MAFNEDTRVKIPAILTLTRLGYDYLSLKNQNWDLETNIFSDVFAQSIKKINNPDTKLEDITKLQKEIGLLLDNDDLGRAFYERLIQSSGLKLIDFDNFENNTFNVVTELTCKNGDDEFRPDITLLINGMPLAFIEVKKPNNKKGILDERERIDKRFQNKKFKKFVNISQILMFSNNMEYDNESIVPIQGAFYCTTSYKKAFFNCFREENKASLLGLLKNEQEDVEDFVLKDNNLVAIKYSPEFKQNKFPDTPTNRLILSLFSKARFKEILRYAIAYVHTQKNGTEKHIMRYPQFFASKAIQRNFDEGQKKGIIWHTQGSGKTALAYYCVHWLTDYFSKKNIIPKFYFVVDRLDLKKQASEEFTIRNLAVHTIDSREDFVKDIKKQMAIHNDKGRKEITVINIQKFSEDSVAVKSQDYNITTQRIYFIDEAHRSYNPTGNFLVNLINSDRDAIFISLTGTPLLYGKNRTASTQIWGDYFHTYYYNSSIADGYTLKLIREGIETKYKMQLEKALEEIQVKIGDIDSKEVYSHPKFVEPMLEYILEDLEKSRIQHNDKTIGGMVVCSSSEQAKALYELFHDDKRKNKNTIKTSALILHDIGTKQDREDKINDFKNGDIDVLFVYNMLLTGFDAPRLKKLYLNRAVKDHNLLQTLTRVNRPYKDFRYGYVVDFADIRKNFDDANKAYWEELQSQFGDEAEKYSEIFKSKEEIEAEIENIKEILFRYDTFNAEAFSNQVTEIDDREELIKIRNALEQAKDLYNLIRLSQQKDLLDRLDFKKFNDLLKMVENRLALVRFKESIENQEDNQNLINEALEDIIFSFLKVSESELKMADEYREAWQKTRECLLANIDKLDPEWVSLKEELERLFKKKNLNEITQEDMQNNIKVLNQIYDRIKELNRKNSLLQAKYQQDQKFARVHKRLIEQNNGLSQKEMRVCDVLTGIKTAIDAKLLLNESQINNEGFFQRLVQGFVVTKFEESSFDLDPSTAKFINNKIVEEYMNEYNGIY